MQAYCSDPTGATTTEFGYVGGLVLSRFYVDPDQPSDNRRKSLWKAATDRMGKTGCCKATGEWGGDTPVTQLQQIIEEACGL